MLVVSESGETDLWLPPYHPRGVYQAQNGRTDKALSIADAKSRQGAFTALSAWRKELLRGRSPGLCARSLEGSAEHTAAHPLEQTAR